MRCRRERCRRSIPCLALGDDGAGRDREFLPHARHRPAAGHAANRATTRCSSGGAARSGAPFPVKVVRPKQSRDRHKRKYAEGELGPDLSFYFRGPDGKLNLRAQNLMLFLQIAEGVDDHTWEHHRARGDYSDWFRHVIKDDELAREAAARSKPMAASIRNESRRQNHRGAYAPLHGARARPTRMTSLKVSAE